MYWNRDFIWCLIAHFILPSNFVTIIQNLVKIQPAKSSTMGSWLFFFSQYKPAFVRVVCYCQQSSCWWLTEHDAVHSKQEDWYTVELYYAAARPGICRWRQPSLPQTTRCTRDAMFCYSKNWERTVFYINIEKTEVMKVNNRQQDPVWIYHENINEANKFVYLGILVNKDSKCWINKANHAFNTLEPI